MEVSLITQTAGFRAPVSYIMEALTNDKQVREKQTIAIVLNSAIRRRSLCRLPVLHAAAALQLQLQRSRQEAGGRR